MRRLPVFFLIDVSESMVGDPIKNVNKGMKKILIDLKGNPMALETAYISVTVFAGKARTIAPLTELLNFDLPEISIGGGTALGNAMNFLMDEIGKQIQKTTYEAKGDWKPIVFLFTDGSPTDDVSPAIKRWESDFKTKANLVAVSIGDKADTTVLKAFTDNVLIFNNTDANAYAEFFKWVSASIETKSMNVAMSGGDEFQLPEADEAILQKDETGKPGHDDRFAILLSRCQKTKKPYLIKFIKESPKSYIPEGAYVISEEYFTLSGGGESPMINTAYIKAVPACPECGHPGFAYCLCGRLFCVGVEGRHRCPWCEQEIITEYSGGFDISRTQG
jgi:uncharacterized protein YegL